MAECAFDLALEEWADREWEELANIHEFEPSKKRERAMKRIFRLYERNTRKFRPRPAVKVGSVTKKVLIAVLALFLALIAGCAATYFISGFRNTVYPEGISLFLYNGNDDCPTTLKNTYFLSKLSGDYTAVHKSDTDTYKSFLYQNTQTGKLVMFRYGVKSRYEVLPTWFDTESGKLSEIKINGSYGVYYENDRTPHIGINNLFGAFRDHDDTSNINSCVWDNGDYIFEIYSDLPKKDIVDLAKSTKVL